MEPRDLTLPGAEGNTIHLLEWSSEGVPFVLLHGFGNDAHIWDDVAPLLAPHYRTVAIDLRGHGDSSHDPEQRYDYPSHVDDLERVLATLDIERFVLMGHSFGGRVSTVFAGRHPQRLAGLVLVDSAPELDARGTTRIMLDMKKTYGESEGGGPAPIRSVAEYARMLSIAYPAAAPETLERMARHGLRERADGSFERKTDPAFHAGRGQMSAEEAAEREERVAKEMWEALGKVPCPALVVRGAASDILSPETADRMADDVLPAGRLAVVARASHSVMTDNPEGFAEAIAEFALG